MGFFSDTIQSNICIYFKYFIKYSVRVRLGRWRNDSLEVNIYAVAQFIIAQGHFSCFEVLVKVSQSLFPYNFLSLFVEDLRTGQINGSSLRVKSSTIAKFKIGLNRFLHPTDQVSACPRIIPLSNNTGRQVIKPGQLGNPDG